MDLFKISVKLSDGAEFSAEGPRATVKEAYQAFLEAARTTSNKRAEHNTQETLDRKDAEALVAASAGPSPSQIDRSALERVFRLDDDAVSLRALPNTNKRDADALLLLIYGFTTLKGQRDVLSTRLVQIARRSGIRANRVDRIIGQNIQYVTRAGFKKGARYGLNNPGLRKAEELLRQILR